MEALLYFGKASLYLLVFYALYYLLLRKLTFFLLNRVYLLSALVLSVLLPLVSLPATETISAFITLPEFPDARASVNTAKPVETGFTFHWLHLFVAYYLFRVGYNTLRLYRQLGALRRMVRAEDPVILDNCKIIFTETQGTFSFLDWILINRDDYARHADTVLRHEMVHVKQRHSLDILLLEVVRIFFWFHPVLLLYKRSLQLVHEYLADQENGERDTYARFLVNYALGAPACGLVNRFFHTSIIKQRITMLYKKQTPGWSVSRYLIAAAITALTVVGVASCEGREKSAEVPVSPTEMVTVRGAVHDEDGNTVPGATLTLEGQQRSTTPGSDGNFTFEQVPKGSVIQIQSDGYNSVKSTPLTAGRNVVTVTLRKGTKNSLARVAMVASFDNKSPDTERLGPDKIFTAVQQQPEFPGGINAMYEFLANNIKYPEAAARAKVSGRVFLQFVVNTHGGISDVEVIKGIGFGADNEAIRVVKAMPKWIPGSQDGTPVNVRYTLPVNFQLE